MELEIGKSSKSKDTLIYCKFEYYKHRENRNGTVKWRCAKYRQFSCSAMLTTDQQKKIIGNTDIQHTHESNVAVALARKAIANMKNQAIDTNATASAIQATVVSSLSDGVLMALPKHSSINRCLQRYRMKVRPAKETGYVFPRNPTDLGFDFLRNYNDFLMLDSEPGDNNYCRPIFIQDAKNC